DDRAEQLAWNWLLANAEAYDAIRTFGGTVLVYETLVEGALDTVRSLFPKLGLGWAPEPEAFLLQSWARDGGYYSVYRRPGHSLTRWREELGADAVKRVVAIARLHPAGRLALREDGPSETGAPESLICA
ncbi:MAG: hypothetical protein ACREQB_03705, partial [Candidatus Binataceae bacterium]